MLSKIIASLALVLALVCPASAQVFPDELVGECPSELFNEQIWLGYVSIDGPISVPIDPDVGYPGQVEFDGEKLHVLLGPLTNKWGSVIGPNYSGYQFGREFWFDPQFCHFINIDVSHGYAQYDCWLFRDGLLYLHTGDFEVGHGNSLEFGVWHLVMVDNPARPLKGHPQAEKHVD